MGKPVISLDELLNETAGRIAVFGKEHDVLSVNAAQYQKLVSHDWASGDLQPVLDVVAEVCPTLGVEARRKLSIKAVTKIAQIAMGIVEHVEADLPNSSGPATSAPAETGTNALHAS